MLTNIAGEQSSVQKETDGGYRIQFLRVNGYLDFVVADMADAEEAGAATLQQWIKDCESEGIAPFRDPEDTSPVPNRETWEAIQELEEGRGDRIPGAGPELY